MRRNRVKDMLFAAGDCIGGAAVGVATAGAVRAVVSPEMDMVVAMLLGMGIGMVVHLVVGVVVSPLLGPYHAMVPGGLIGMYGGMMFAMRDTMQHGVPLTDALAVGAGFGVVMVIGLQVYDLRCPGPRGGWDPAVRR